jgi:hypothetical protein
MVNKIRGLELNERMVRKKRRWFLLSLLFVANTKLEKGREKPTYTLAKRSGAE